MLISRSRTIISLGLLFISCGGNHRNHDAVTHAELKEPLIDENIKITTEERRLIERYIDRHNWKMEETGTGLRYMIYQQGYGVKAEKGMTATVEYEIALTDGRICYSSADKGPRSFVIGKDNVESGIHEGILHMKVGDKATLIVPSYLAHGLSGDNNKIPPRATLVVDLHLKQLE
jgi:FKBP-type peptidyl-prolyl cis-trans isomerase